MSEQEILFRLILVGIAIVAGCLLPPLLFIIGGIYVYIISLFNDGEAYEYKKRNTSNGVIQEEPFLSEEEILAAGLYPDDDGYKMSLISNILNK